MAFSLAFIAFPSAFKERTPDRKFNVWCNYLRHAHTQNGASVEGQRASAAGAENPGCQWWGLLLAKRMEGGRGGVIFSACNRRKVKSCSENAMHTLNAYGS